jgi:hypothetical protein
MNESTDTIDCAGIIKSYLISHEYDGLVSIDNDCGCTLDDLMPCGGKDVMDCIAGYWVKGCQPLCGEGCDFHVFPGRRPGK